MTSISWLHLSDFHQGQPHASTYDWLPIRDRLFDDLEHIHAQSGAWDAILFTGDATFNGSAEQFGKLASVLVDLQAHIARLQTTKPVLVAIPGNHDLARPDATVAADIRAEFTDAARREAFWADASHPARNTLATLFQEFAAWQAVACGGQPGPLPGDRAWVIEKDHLRIGIIGLNSAFRHLSDADRQGDMVIAPAQFYQTCGSTPEKWLDECDAVLLLTHHPPEWLDAISKKEYEEQISGWLTMHLYGHMHESNFLAVSFGAHPQTRWQSPSLYGLEKHGTPPALVRLHGYSVARLDIDGGSGTIRLWPREAVLTKGGWSFGPAKLSLQSDGGTDPVFVNLTRRLQKIPRVIRKLLEERKLRRQAQHQHVETTEQEFLETFDAVTASLDAGSEIVATDHLRFDRENYWLSQVGLRYLEINHRATGRGVIVKRIFLVSGGDWDTKRNKITTIMRLHNRAGVEVSITLMEDIPADCRVELAVVGPELVDLPRHNAEGMITQNIISWNPAHRAEAQRKLTEIINNTKPQRPKTTRDTEFNRVRSYAKSIKKHGG